MHHSTLLRRHPDLLRGGGAVRLRDEAGATTAEYATVTGAAVGFGALLWKLITSELGMKILQMVFDWVLSLLPG
ncbi:DUF4244 domain-containing protein [Nocardioides aequoreus]|uniref:DUF4244 domain-containing protein n=1 Tax=Nocardioides aequoreus TaxID=397278 RepID=UPI0004C3742A|nr:DUF4244 domain-containing protein [Nocardioides aequoreus]